MKMVQTHASLANVAVIVLLLYLHITSLEAKKLQNLCPIGFRVAKTSDGEPICYRQKGPEEFEDKFQSCAGNLFTWKLFTNLNIPATAQTIWTDYKNVYDGGPFVDWSYTKDSGNELKTSLDVSRDSVYNVNEELCVVVDPVMNFTAVRCYEKHYRYCIIDVYKDLVDMGSEGCDDMNNLDSDHSDYTLSEELQRQTYRFWSPMPTCLLQIVPESGSGVRMTWNQSQRACQKRGGSLLNRGWRYSNHPLFRSGKLKIHLYPFGVRANGNISSIQYDTKNDKSIIPRSEWPFDVSVLSDTSVGAVQNESWSFVNSSYTFFDVICEKTVPLKHVNLSVYIDSDTNNIILTSNDTDLDKKYIYCFTDSWSYHPQRVPMKKKTINGKPAYILQYIGDGYYWCTHGDSRQFYISESNKVLRLTVNGDTENLYAVKVTSLAHDYTLANIGALVQNNWKKKIEEYVFYSTQYKKTYGPSDSYDNHTIWAFRNDRPGMDVKNAKVVLKRVYLNSRSVLLHVTLHRNMLPVAKGQWDDIQIDFMQPAYFCETNEHLTDRLALNETKQTSTCQIYQCIGDFNEGVRLIITGTSSYCYTPMPATVDVTVDDYTDVSSGIGPDHLVIDPDEYPMIHNPQQQLDSVIENINLLLNNTDEPLLVRDIQDTVEQVDEFLDERDDVEIPGDLLHLLDEMGARVDLNGTTYSTTVKNNLAIVVADAQPKAPVYGLKIATRNSDVFTENAFEIIRDDINSTQLMAEANEVVVDLPVSLISTQQRISFVVFRNDRAFQSSHGLYSVNSRILSVNIQNTTKFDNGEFINIYLTPTGTADRNQSRSCAFWKFVDDGPGVGYWSQEGCTFVRATTPGMLDRCKCDHLTHFAEVLIPRTVFSERNESILETISVVGCFMSIIGLIFVGVTALTFRAWRRDYSNKIWLQLCISIFIMSIAFLIVIYAQFEEYGVGCMLVGILLHFSVLSSFCWMLVAAALSYRRLVTVFSVDASHKLLRACAFAWGVPCAIVGILLSVAPHAYSGRLDDKNPSTAFCYPSGLARWLSVFGPIALMLLVNWTLFALIVRSVFASRRNHPNIQIGNRHSSDRNEALRCASVSFFLVFLFGLPWIFGLFSMNVAMAYCFVLLSTFQGFVLFLFFVLGNKKTRDLWMNKLKIKQTKKIPVTSSTYTNNTNNKSTGSNTNSRNGNKVETIETKISKPRSLSSLDDSRFS